jgi:hypothetical protein
LTLLACGGGQQPPKPPAPAHLSRPLLTAPLAGQALAVVPLTLLITDDSTSRVAPLGDRVVALAWADSTVGAALEARGPEVKWVLAPALRKVARRAPGIAPDPDRMGQAILRVEKLADVPDPLRSSLRTLMALVGGRYVLVPAALGFLIEPDGQVGAELSLVLADTRDGKVLWRSLARGTGATPARALAAAMETVLPLGLGMR